MVSFIVKERTMILIEARVVNATHLQLARPITAKKGQTVYIAVEETEKATGDRGQWHAAAVPTLQAAYGDSEPYYTPAMVKDPNADYCV